MKSYYDDITVSIKIERSDINKAYNTPKNEEEDSLSKPRFPTLHSKKIDASLS